MRLIARSCQGRVGGDVVGIVTSVYFTIFSPHMFVTDIKSQAQHFLLTLAETCPVLLPRVI